MIETIETNCQSFDITSPDSSLPRTKHIIGLVDNKRQYANEKIIKKYMCKKIQTVASTWEQILHTFGGGLELAKCGWYLITWEFMDNEIPYINKHNSNKRIDIKPFNDNIR